MYYVYKIKFDGIGFETAPIREEYEDKSVAEANMDTANLDDFEIFVLTEDSGRVLKTARK